MELHEGLKAGDLEGLINKRFEIDRYKSKMGDDKDVCVLAFTADGAAPAKDLERFAEKGYKKILDADATPGTMADGKYRIFVEFERNENMDTAIYDFLEDLKKLCAVEIWEFTYHKKPVPFEASKANLNAILPRTAEAYIQKVSQLRLGEVASFFDKFNLIEFKLDDNHIHVSKGSDKRIFELKAYGDTQSVLKEVQAFKIDMDSMAECIELTKYFGPFNITKTSNDDYVFSKNNESCIIGKR